MDIRRPGWPWRKAMLLALTGAPALAPPWLEYFPWWTAAYTLVAVWAFARAHYFAFYAIQHYIDPSYRFAGLGGALAHGRETFRRGGVASTLSGSNVAEEANNAPAAATAFERVAATCDANRRRLPPDIDDFHGAVPRVLAGTLGPMPRILPPRILP